MIVFCSYAFFQPEIILFLINYYREFFMTNIKIYQCFRHFFSMLFIFFPDNKVVFLFLIFSLFIVFGNILTIPLLIGNTRLILALAIPTGIPMTVINQQRKTPLLTPDKTSTALSAQSSAVINLLIVLLVFSVSVISAIK